MLFIFLGNVKNKIVSCFNRVKNEKNMNNPNNVDTMEIFAKRIKEAKKFFEKNSAHIEIVRDNEVEKVYFILNPFCKWLPNVF